MKLFYNFVFASKINIYFLPRKNETSDHNKIL